MTAYEEIKQETTLNNIRNLILNGASMELISKSFGLPVHKIEKMLPKIKDTNS